MSTQGRCGGQKENEREETEKTEFYRTLLALFPPVQIVCFGFLLPTPSCLPVAAQPSHGLTGTFIVTVRGTR
jgi:hypothetical protein